MRSTPIACLSVLPGAGGRRPVNHEAETVEAATLVPLQFKGKRHTPFSAANHEFSHVSSNTWLLRATQAFEDISDAWIGISSVVELAASSNREMKLFQRPTCISRACAPIRNPFCSW
jgi:hypothetical protein